MKRFKFVGDLFLKDDRWRGLPNNFSINSSSNYNFNKTVVKRIKGAHDGTRIFLRYSMLGVHRLELLCINEEEAEEKKKKAKTLKTSTTRRLNQLLKEDLVQEYLEVKSKWDSLRH